MEEDIGALKNLKFDPKRHDVVRVTFNDKGSVYSYFCPEGLVVNVGQRILVVSPYNGLTTVTVKSVTSGASYVGNPELKPIYGVIAPECNVWGVGIKRKAQQLMDLQNLQKELKTRQEAINESAKELEKLKREILESQKYSTSYPRRDDNIDALRYGLKFPDKAIIPYTVTETEDPF